MTRIVRVGAGLFAVVVVLVALGGCGTTKSGPPVPKLPAGQVVDDGFRPGSNGLPFENYGDVLSSGSAPTNMTPADVEEMFGSFVCADAQAGKCDLIPEAQAWLDATNAQMAGGHCYGFSVLAGLLWQGNITSNTFGATDTTGLQIDENQALQRQIAYDWAIQILDSIQSHRVEGTPNKILLTLMAALKPHPSQTYTIVLWKRDGTGGHAVTPYAIDSKGDGNYDVLIYDNNWPNQTRAISFNTNANTWSYNAAINPNAPDSLYEGDAKTETIALDPASPGLGTQPCPFCGKVPKNAASSAEKNGLEEISLAGPSASHANLVITDDAGHKLGYINGKLVNQIHGAHDHPVISDQDWTNSMAADFFVPADNKYTITLDGHNLTAPINETLNIIGPSSDLSISNIHIGPGETDTLVAAPDDTQLSYKATKPELPTFQLGVSDNQADYSFKISGVSDQPGSTLNIAIPPEGSTVSLQNVGSTTQSTINFSMTRETEQGVQTFSHNSIPLANSDKAQLNFATWANASEALPLTTVHNGQSSTQDLTNQSSQ
jgi:hypothetical protein